MENRAETRMAAAANYYARRWGQPVPAMTPRFAELIITRWKAAVQQGIVAIPTEDSRNHKPSAPQRTHFDFGGSSIDLGRNEIAIGRQIYQGPTR